MFAYVWDGEVHHLEIYITSSGLLPESCRERPLGMKAGLPLGLLSVFASRDRIVSADLLHSKSNHIEGVQQMNKYF